MACLDKIYIHTKGKLRTYKEIKYIVKYEDHLELPLYLRNLLTKPRISNYPLRIETGSYCSSSLPINNHACPICEDTVEDEPYFVFGCHLYHLLEEHIGRCYFISKVFSYPSYPARRNGPTYQI